MVFAFPVEIEDSFHITKVFRVVYNYTHSAGGDVVTVYLPLIQFVYAAGRTERGIFGY